jgi:hypothetical protein
MSSLASLFSALLHYARIFLVVHHVIQILLLLHFKKVRTFATALPELGQLCKSILEFSATPSDRGGLPLGTTVAHF